MNEIKRRLTQAVTESLSAAPDSAAKAELIEELAENLYARYQDMTAGGMDEEDAFRTALDNLGDTDELVDYLNSLAPDEPLPGSENGRFHTRTRVVHDGETVLDLDELLNNVEELVRGAVDKARSVTRDAVNRIKWDSDNVRVDVTVDSDGRCADQDENAADAEDREADRDDVIYGIGYDRSKGGWFAQWGKRKYPHFQGENAWMESESDGTYTVNGSIRAIDVEVGGDITVRIDGSAEQLEENGTDETLELTRSQGGRLTDLHIGSGADAIKISGDLDELEILSENGVLTIRQGRTASGGFLFRRGLYSADVELVLPSKVLESIRLSSVDGDMELTGATGVSSVNISTVSGDVRGELPGCDKLKLHSVSGDVRWHGDAQEAKLESVSGDIRGEGAFDILSASTMSGDIELLGACRVNHVRCSSMSGDIDLESGTLPQAMELSSKSGDITVSLPDQGPFSIQYKTTSGAFTSDFFEGYMGGKHSTFRYGPDNAEGPAYRMSTISGDLRLEKL